MQLSICCSSRARDVAAHLTLRLEKNLGVQTLLVEEDAVSVSETWEEGAAGDAILILLDGLSAPPPLRREAWTGLIDHEDSPPVAYSVLGECAYPKLLERRRFLPATDALALERAAEKWIVSLMPAVEGIAAAPCHGVVPEDWQGLLVDQPGEVHTEDVAAAQAFAHATASHFQGVLWLGCAGREPALIRSELEYRLRGEGRRLVVLAHAEKPIKTSGGPHSYVQVLGQPAAAGDAAAGACYAPRFPGWLARELGSSLAGAIALDAGAGLFRLTNAVPTTDAHRQHHLEIVHRHFQHWRSNPEPCSELVAEVPAAIQHGFHRDWQRGTELCRRTAYFLIAEGRRREGIRLWHRLLLEAEERQDAENAEIARHELSWLTDEEGEPVRAVTAEAVQMALELSS